MTDAPVRNLLIRQIDRLAISLAIIGGLVPLLAFVYFDYANHRNIANYKASISANTIAEFAYRNGERWKYAGHRLPEILARQTPDTVTYQELLDIDGTVLAASGPALARPFVQVSVPVTVGGEAVSTVSLKLSLRDLIDDALRFSLLTAAISAVFYIFLKALPLKALSRTAKDLENKELSLQAQVELTQEALNSANEHRFRAEAAGQAKSEFLTHMSHELRTPLNAIIGFSDLIRSNLYGDVPPKYREYADDINSSGRHLLDLVNEILDMAKIENGQQELALAEIDGISLASECIRLMADLAAQRDIELELMLPSSNEAPAILDRVRARQILINLLSNAIKFTPPGGDVKCEVLYEPGSSLTYEITDSGVGMTESEIEIALKPFQQVSRIASLAAEGTGLGLPLAEALTRLHGGRLDITSRRDVGTTVRISFPLLSAGAIPSSSESDGSSRIAS